MPHRRPRHVFHLLLSALLGGLLASGGAGAQEAPLPDTPQGRLDPTQAPPAPLDWLITSGTGKPVPRTTPRGVIIAPRPTGPAAEVAPEAPDNGGEASPTPRSPASPTGSAMPEAPGADTAAPVSSPPEAEPRPRPGRRGYAFDRPRVLAQQAIFGIAHGVALLGRACALAPDSAPDTAAAYAAWNDKNQARIDSAARELAGYYFAPPLDGVRHLHLVQALGLKTDLGLSTDSPELQAACATLPQALQNPRYDLETVWRLYRDTERLRRATEFRETLAQCRQQAEPEAVEKFDAALARWEQDNAALEAAARERLLTDPERNPATGSRGLADNAKALENWQAELRQAVRRRIAYTRPAPQTPCTRLTETEALNGPDYALTRAFDEDKYP